MPRSNKTAKNDGYKFQIDTAKYLADALGDDRIIVQQKHGSNDLGDIANVRTRNGHHVVIECKYRTRTDLAGWINEAHREAAHDGALVGVVCHKRVGKGEKHFGEQWVTMTLDDFVELLLDEQVGDRK